MHGLRLHPGLFVLLVLLSVGAPASPVTEPAPRARPGPSVAVVQQLDIPLVDLTWMRNGEPTDLPRLEGEGTSRRVRLPVDATGVRWSTVFETGAAATWRLQLDWNPGPDGLLYEVMLDGERQPPPRDGWRPTRRRLLSDLGPRWLGAGQHLLEFIAREEVTAGAFELSRLQLEQLGNG